MVDSKRPTRLGRPGLRLWGGGCRCCAWAALFERTSGRVEVAAFRTDVFWRAKRRKFSQLFGCFWEGHGNRECMGKSVSVMAGSATLAAATRGMVVCLSMRANADDSDKRGQIQPGGTDSGLAS